MGQSHQIYLLNGFRLDSDARALTHGDQAIHLPRKPFQVLLYLIENRDRYVSRAELLETFWNGHDVYDDALRKCVGAIRKALDDVSQKPRFVETRWGVGYRYIGPIEEHVVRPEAAVVEIERTRGVSIIVEEEEIDDGRPVVDLSLVNKRPIESLPTGLFAHGRTLFVTTLGIVVVVAATVLASYWLQPHSPEHINSIAVLPLKNLTGDPSNDFLSDGITESMITSLSKIEDLKVISRGSVFTFKDKNVDPRDAGRSLGVMAVLEGSVRQNGDRLRVDVRLVSTSNGEVLWAGDAYDRSNQEIFAIEDEVVRDLTVRLRTGPGMREEQRHAKRPTNAEAYKAYLKGRYFLNKRTSEGIIRGIEYFEQAVSIDPNYALAYASLAHGYDKACWFVHRLPHESVQKEKTAAQKAVLLDNSLSEAHAALSAVYAQEWDITNAVKETELAIGLNPGDAEAHHQYAYDLLHVGRADEAIAEVKRARELDPLNVVMNVDVGEILLYARRYDEAIEALEDAVEMDSDRANAHYDLAIAYEMKGMSEQAFEEYLRNEQLNGSEDEQIALLKTDYAAMGLTGYWHRTLQTEEAESERGYIQPLILAKAYARLGDRDAAFNCLERAYLENSPTLLDLKIDPSFDTLRSDPRYIDLVRRVGL
jgi:TolB-like protein/DNA-binding winged helix-turn-helix (wHTH) protein/Tfp pilus assembly protein PilF